MNNINNINNITSNINNLGNIPNLNNTNQGRDITFNPSIKIIKKILKLTNKIIKTFFDIYNNVKIFLFYFNYKK